MLNVAAVAMPDPVLGEKTCAYVVTKIGNDLSLEELVAFLKERRIARYKLPERLEVADSLPLTSVGKINKKALRMDVASKLEAERGVTA